MPSAMPPPSASGGCLALQLVGVHVEPHGGSECKEDISRLPPLEARISGPDEDHAVGDNWPTRGRRAAPRDHTVDGREFLRAIELPQQLTRARRRRANHAIPC